MTDWLSKLSNFLETSSFPALNDGADLLFYRRYCDFQHDAVAYFFYCEALDDKKWFSHTPEQRAKNEDSQLNCTLATLDILLAGISELLDGVFPDVFFFSLFPVIDRFFDPYVPNLKQRQSYRRMSRTGYQYAKDLNNYLEECPNFWEWLEFVLFVFPEIYTNRNLNIWQSFDNGYYEEGGNTLVLPKEGPIKLIRILLNESDPELVLEVVLHDACSTDEILGLMSSFGANVEYHHERQVYITAEQPFNWILTVFCEDAEFRLCDSFRIKSKKYKFSDQPGVNADSSFNSGAYL